MKGYNYKVVTSYWYLNMRYTIIGCSRKRSFPFLKSVGLAITNLIDLQELGIVMDKSNQVYKFNIYRDVIEKTIKIWLGKGIIQSEFKKDLIIQKVFHSLMENKSHSRDIDRYCVKKYLFYVQAKGILHEDKISI